ncbi:MAG: alanine racemase, partial [Pyrinomonadaceae bacterium]|nr:alanine racemase [Pyrinomonadaceae bacterium]
VAMACPIVAIHEKRNEIVTYGGGVHLSKENLNHEEYGTIYGLVAEKKGDAWGEIIPGMFVKSLSQEHGIVAVPTSEISSWRVGDYVLILPVHSCMTANLMKEYLTTGSDLISRL